MGEILLKTSAPSTAFFKEAKFTILSGRKCSLEYCFEDEKENLVVFEKLIFEGVESFKCTYFRACSIEMIEAYDKLIELDKTDWLTEIQQNLSKEEADSNNLKHLRIYFDDGPCYEFICRSFEIVNSLQENYSVTPA